MHVVAERHVHVATLELAGQAAAVEGRDGVSTVKNIVFLNQLLENQKLVANLETYLYKCLRFGSSSVLRKYL